MVGAQRIKSADDLPAGFELGGAAKNEMLQKMADAGLGGMFILAAGFDYEDGGDGGTVGGCG